MAQTAWRVCGMLTFQYKSLILIKLGQGCGWNDLPRPFSRNR